MKNLVKYSLLGSAILLSACQSSSSVATQKLPENFELKSADWFAQDSGDPLGGLATIKHIENNLYEIKVESDEAKSQASGFSKDKTLFGRFYICTANFIAASSGAQYYSIGLMSHQSNKFTNPYVVKLMLSSDKQAKFEGEASKYVWDVDEAKQFTNSTEKYTQYCQNMFERYPLK